MVGCASGSVVSEVDTNGSKEQDVEFKPNIMENHLHGASNTGQREVSNMRQQRDYVPS